MDESFIILGNAVRRARKQMKISQEKLAELIQDVMFWKKYEKHLWMCSNHDIVILEY